MKIRKKAEAVRHENSEACVAYEYEMPSTEIDGAVIELTGRYPEDGWVINTVSTSLVHIVRGRGKVYFPDEEVVLAEDDQVMILPNEKYAFDGDMKLLFFAAPAWTPEQARRVK